MLFKNGLVFTDSGVFRRLDVRTNGDRIAEIGENLPENGEEVKDLSGKKLVPGFIDIHTHGCGGCDFCDATPEAYQTMADTYLKAGVTTVLGTSMTLPVDQLLKIFTAYREFADHQTHGARMVGINMEGPFISAAKKGAHIAEYVVPADFETFQKLNEASGGRIRQVDVAPEIPGNLDFIRKASEVCTVCVAHTAGGYEEAMAAYAAGAASNTHLYNAMSGFSHRAPGVVGAVFDSDTFAEIICDGFHINPAVIRATFREMGDDRLCLISDSLRAAGCPNGVYELGGQQVHVQDGKATLENGTIAGSVIDSRIAVERAIAFGVGEETALKAATINPARAIRLDREIGSITVGKLADLLVVSDCQYRSLEEIYQGGVRQ
ncbi:MAG TPA: N-acetylglucosamine-6-phosphate deacetylase [Candidatus Merdivicinus intestinavium]|nr:N-acetylglucosamine-6-phosphate deacetylase [Candidatus Merdivicinus intestinavium]